MIPEIRGELYPREGNTDLRCKRCDKPDDLYRPSGTDRLIDLIRKSKIARCTRGFLAIELDGAASSGHPAF